MLTVVIPSYNHADYIVDSLKAALAIAVPGLKVLIVDDGSKDRSMELVRAYVEQSGLGEKVTIVEKANGGLVSSLNESMKRIDTEFCWFVASDDILIPEGVAKVFAEIKAKPELGFVIGGGHYFNADGALGPIYNARHDRFFALERSRREREMYTHYPSPILLQSTIFRVEALRRIGGWDPALRLDDYPTFVKLLSVYDEAGRDFGFNPLIDCVRYRQHGTNTSKNLSMQLRMVRGALVALAPDHIRREAIANAAAYYSLNALKHARFGFFVDLVRECDLDEIVLSLIKMPIVAVQHVVARK
ncbi:MULTISPECIES: glycosyltransferase family 2 protein [unclassified Pseudomonas]|uniref:glycosyltransferase family 2 protein n=1 Tax=unclassified Pseudomonas TaxID=196821 RepID=UPI000483E622|nr:MULTISPECIES: glycosyltransferase family 2 protein [unclassified Pseudomonas]RAS26167.1 alpha-1,3-rhamnosyltransferase [Pseudomonas sp. URMO17WK12:I7]SMF42086.1 alpha-1,3-rhamnosyltransferase [Pseudomonas sp. URMO17WK12:I5]